MKFVPLVEPARAEPALEAYRGRLAELERLIASLESSKDAAARRTARRAEGRAGAAEAALAADEPAGRLRRDRGHADGRPAATPGRAGQSRPGRPPRRAAVRVPGRRGAAAAGTGEQRPTRAGRWLTRPDHPLTARVMVNRIWQHHFGRGIVATPSNLGVRGEPPTHPELLDWLAARFVAEGWSIKAIHREIVLSATYQLSSDHDDPQRRARPRQPMALAIPPPPARRRVDPRRHARRLRPARPRPAGPPPVPADRGLALDAARRLQDGLSRRTTAAST